MIRKHVPNDCCWCQPVPRITSKREQIVNGIRIIHQTLSIEHNDQVGHALGLYPIPYVGRLTELDQSFWIEEL